MNQLVRRGGLVPKPTFASLAASYPKKSIPRAELFDELGIGELINNPAYENTCGIRMSYAIARAGTVLGAMRRPVGAQGHIDLVWPTATGSRMRWRVLLQPKESDLVLAA